MAWTENKDANGKITSYSQRTPGGTSENPLTLKAKLDGSQEIVDKSGKVIATRTADQKEFQAKDGSWNQIDQNTKNAISTSAKENTYKLVQDRGTAEQKESVKNKEQYKSSSNTFDEQIESDKGYRATDVDTSSGVAAFFPVGKTFNGRLQYPLQMSDQQDKIKFTAVEIEKGQFSAPSSAGGVSSFSSPNVTYKKVDSSIYMAIQGPISDTNTAQWGEGKLSAIDAFVFNASRNLMAGDGGGGGDMIGELFKGLGDGQQELKDYLAGQAASIPDILSRTKTKVLNPNLELLFQGPQLRPFQFSFKMSARDENEATAIKFIIKYFKRHMAVRRDNTALFLKAPHVFTIQYLKGNEIHPSMNLISPVPSGETKAAALIACSVNYTPLGNYATYNDSAGTMVSYELNMQFQEIEPLYDTDYTEGFGKDHLIGY